MSIPKNSITVSVIIPTYNESCSIENCLQSLRKQSYKALEVIVVDDQSTDNTARLVRRVSNEPSFFRVNLYEQMHSGPGVARNLGASYAKGRILVFVDADMTFSEDFIGRLVAPIEAGETIGTNSQEEYLLNAKNFWARCWNMAKFAAAGNFTDEFKTEMIPEKLDRGGVFRAILKSEFEKVGGFEAGGDYTDDTSLTGKLGLKATIVAAEFYHRNPDNISEVWLRARWIGSGRNFTKGTKRKLISLIRFFPVVSIVKSIIIASRFRYYPFVLFKLIYDSAIFSSVLLTLL